MRPTLRRWKECFFFTRRVEGGEVHAHSPDSTNNVQKKRIGKKNKKEERKETERGEREEREWRVRVSELNAPVGPSVPTGQEAQHSSSRLA